MKLNMPNRRLSNFYIRSSLFSVLSLAGAVINYALYPVLAHILNVRHFGDFAVIVALSNQMLAILLAFNITSIALVKNNPEDVAREKAQVIQKILIRFFILLSIIVLGLSSVLKKKLKVDESFSFFILALLLLINVPVVIWGGYLQGHKRLVNVGWYTFSGAFLKFLLAILLGAAFGVIGALWGVLGGTIGGLLILRYTSDIKLPRIKSVFTKLDSIESSFLKDLRPYIIQALFVVGGLGFLQNIDITYVKAMFDSGTAGLYSGISILSNSLYYVVFLLVWIILPEIEPASKKVNRRIISRAYKLIGLMTALIMIVETGFKDNIARLLLGPAFGQQGDLLIFATLYQITLVSVSLYAFYLLVMRSAKSFWLALSIILPCTILPWIFNNSPREVIIALWLSVLLGLACYCIINIVIRRQADDGSQRQAN
jgi:O-antigen/teichoic acid export membrane protein